MKQIFFYTVAALLFMAPAAAQQKQTPPAGGKAKDFKLPAKKVTELSNGMKATFVHYGDLPKVSVSLIIKTGNAHEAPNEIWLADLTGRMLREGTSSMNFSALSKKAAMMGGTLNVSVGLTQTVVSGSVLSEYAADFIKLISGLVTAPAFPASELERHKTDLRRRMITQKAIPQSQAQEQFYQAMYKGTRYADLFPTDAIIGSFTVDQVRGFYEKQFGARRSVLYVVGKFDDAPVQAAAQSFAGWRAGPAVSFPEVKASPVGDTLVADRKGAPQTTLMVGLPVVTPNNKDYVPLLVANSLLGGSFGSRITSNIREQKGYTYSPFSTVNNRIGSTLWYESADVTSEHTIASLQEIEKEIRRLQLEAPSKEELEGIQNYEAGIFVLQNSSPGGIINQLNFLDLYGLDDSYLTNYVKNIYKVTPEMVSQIAKQYIRYEKMTKVMVGDKAQIDQQVEKAKQNAGKKTF
jgi:zinc protease